MAQSGGSCSPCFEDLLDHDPGFRRRLTQALQVGGRIPESVDVVDPQAVDDALVQPVEHQPVAVGEDGVTIDPDAGQGGDVEKAPVVQFLAGRAPPGHPVVLPADQVVEAVDVVVDELDLGVDGQGHLGALVTQPGQPGPEDLLVPVALPHALVVDGP